jgi:exosome complex component RRP45
LCIIAGKKVWALRIDIHVIDNDGNLLDASHIAAITALLNFRRPEITIKGEDVIIHEVSERYFLL